MSLFYLQEMKVQISKLLRRAAARGPFVWVVPASWKRQRRVSGTDAGKGVWIADDFDDPLPPEIQKYFE